MRLSYRWLQEYAPTTLPVKELGERFTFTSSEVESLEDWKERFENIVIGKVLEVADHPNADRLHVTKIAVGSKQVRTIVCGASNIAEGQYVAVALPGAVLGQDKGETVTIRETKIRGVHSEGMVCAASELGLDIPGAEDGIWVLNNLTEKPLAAGQSFAATLELDDSVLDLEITPNRPDLLNYVGLAREVAAFEHVRLTEPRIFSLETSGTPLPTLVRASIDDASACIRYSALCFTVSSTAPSPWWIQRRLILAGMKPINAIVDVTNYVMLELGQPLHAFDFDAVLALQDSNRTPHIVVRKAAGGETLDVLDNTTRVAQAGDILITTAHGKPLAFGGIIGGVPSSIQPSTKRIILESATFHGPHIRRTSRHLGLRTEASTRFEKGIDSELTVTALKRAAYLLEEIGAATPCSSLVDVRPPHEHATRPRIHVPFSQVQDTLGVRIGAQEAKSIIQKLGFQILSVSKSSLVTTPPTWRQDVRLVEDVMEELLRIWGYDRVPSTFPQGLVSPPFPNPVFDRLNTLRHALANHGFYETVHLPFTNTRSLERLHIKDTDAVALDNPLSREQTHLITTHLIPLLANCAGVNLDQEELLLFEIGHIFSAGNQESARLSMLVRTENTDTELLIRQLKGWAEFTLNRLDVRGFAYDTEAKDPGYYDANAYLTIQDTGGRRVARLGRIASECVQSHKIRRGRTIGFIEIDLDLVKQISDPNPSLYVPLPVYPGIVRDLTIVVSDSCSWMEIDKTVSKASDTNIVRTILFVDSYKGKNTPEGHKAVTLRVTYGSPERTLEEKEVTADMDRIRAACIKKLNAHINE